jgi:ATP-dependent Clp protease protease subunit
VREKLNLILKFHTRQNIKTIQKDTDRDNFMSALEATKYGLIDKVLTKR